MKERHSFTRTYLLILDLCELLLSLLTWWEKTYNKLTI